MTNYIIANMNGEVLETKEASKKATVEKYASEKYSDMETWVGTENQHKKEFEEVVETAVEEIVPSETSPETEIQEIEVVETEQEAEIVETSQEVVETTTEVAVVETAPVQEVTTEKKAVDNKDKKPQFLNIQEVTKLYSEYGIKCLNENAKGNYRIMGGAKGSSLHVKPTKGYYIYSTNADFELIKNAGLGCEDLIVEEGTNSSDRVRPNTIICKTVDTLKSLLQIYATNPFNKLQATA